MDVYRLQAGLSLIIGLGLPSQAAQVVHAGTPGGAALVVLPPFLLVHRVLAGRCIHSFGSVSLKGGRGRSGSVVTQNCAALKQTSFFPNVVGTLEHIIKAY
jgi:hypothetical protein